MFVFIGVMVLLSLVTANKNSAMGCLLLFGTLLMSMYILGDQMVEAVHTQKAATQAPASGPKPQQTRTAPAAPLEGE